MKELEKQTPIDAAEMLETRKIFYVGSPTDETVLVAIHPHYQKKAQVLTWWDTIKERAKKINNIQVTDENRIIQIKDTQNNSYIFVPLSLPLYNNIIKERLPGIKEFTTEEEMLKTIEETMKLE